MIKISFSGISGSGKTSLLLEVKKILSLKGKVNTLNEINGQNPYDNVQRSNFASQFFYITTQINQENFQSQTPADFLLCDRSIVDQWIYWKRTIADKAITPQLEERTNMLYSLYQFWIKTYDLIFFIRADLKDMETRQSASEFRNTDIEYMKKTEELFLETIKDDHLNVVEIWNTTTIDEAAHQIVKAITEYKVIQVA